MTVPAVVVCASGVLYWAGVLVQSVRVRRRIGRWPNLRPRGVKERLLWMGWLLVISVWIVQPVLLGRLAAAPLLAVPRFALELPVAILGAALVVLGQAGTYWSYAALAHHWRLGVNRKEETELITTGPYGRVRHPIYSFQIVILLGAALLLPTVISVAILGLHYVCCRVKALDEETYLAGLHGQAYVDYEARTGRFVPKRLQTHGQAGPLQRR